MLKNIVLIWIWSLLKRFALDRHLSVVLAQHFKTFRCFQHGGYFAWRLSANKCTTFTWIWPPSTFA